MSKFRYILNNVIFYKVDSICKKFNIENYTINNNGSINVDGDVRMRFQSYNKSVNIPLTFNKVDGDFYCYCNDLKTLKGCPKIVSGNFNCSNNRLKTLKGCPTEIGGNFDCSDNELTTLKDGPKVIGSQYRDGGKFSCYNNFLTNLIGIPKGVINIDCSDNNLNTLKGCPIEIHDFDCSSNKLTNLIGIPKEIKGQININHNPLPNEIYDYYNKNGVSIKDIIRLQDDYGIWNRDGSLNKYRFDDMMEEINISKK